MKKNTYKKVCQYCGETFETTNYRKINCSNTCKTYSSNKRTGKLNDLQLKIQSGEITPILDINNDKELSQEAEFILLKILTFDEHADMGYFKPVIQLNENMIIARSTAISLIKSIQERFNGTKIISKSIKTKVGYITTTSTTLNRDNIKSNI